MLSIRCGQRQRDDPPALPSAVIALRQLRLENGIVLQGMLDFETDPASVFRNI
jgi:hypothetical protein